MPCPNCNCRECKSPKAAPVWTHYPEPELWVGTSYRATVGEISGEWRWWVWDKANSRGPFNSKEAAQQAAEAATLPAGSTPAPTK